MSKMQLYKKLLCNETTQIRAFLSQNALETSLHVSPIKDTTVYTFAKEIYLLEAYKKNLCNLSILIFLSAEQNPTLLEPLKNLPDITNDERYSKDTLKLFGDPQSFEFELKEVYKKCESVGLGRLDLHFQGGMSSAKVFKVLLYRLNQLFKLHFEAYLEGVGAYEKAKKSHSELGDALELSKNIFCKKCIKKLQKKLGDFYLLCNQKDRFENFQLNFSAFVADESDFYEDQKSLKCLHFYLQNQKNANHKDILKKYFSEIIS